METFDRFGDVLTWGILIRDVVFYEILTASDLARMVRKYRNRGDHSYQVPLNADRQLFFYHFLNTIIH